MAASERELSGDDRALLEAVRDGDERALDELLRRYEQVIYRFGLRMCRDSDDAEEVLQDTLLAAAQGVQEFRGTSSLSTWLYTIARSFCIKRRRRSKFALAEKEPLDAIAGGPDAAADPRPLPDAALESRRIEQALEEAIAALDPKYREVLILRDMEGLTAPEVAEVMGIGVGAIKSRLHRARLAVREALGPLVGGGEERVPGAGCPDVLQRYSEHLEGELSPAICEELERHLEGCEDCTSACDSLKRSLALCSASSREAQVPAQVQASIRAALDNVLGESRGG